MVFDFESDDFCMRVVSAIWRELSYENIEGVASVVDNAYKTSFVNQYTLAIRALVAILSSDD